MTVRPAGAWIEAAGAAGGARSRKASGPRHDAPFLPPSGDISSLLHQRQPPREPELSLAPMRLPSEGGGLFALAPASFRSPRRGSRPGAALSARKRPCPPPPSLPRPRTPRPLCTPSHSAGRSRGLAHPLLPARRPRLAASPPARSAQELERARTEGRREGVSLGCGAPRSAPLPEALPPGLLPRPLAGGAVFLVNTIFYHSFEA